MPFGTDFDFTNMNVAVCIAALVSYGALYAWKARNSTKTLPHPPGPPGFPLIGNLADLPSQPAWIAYLKMGEKYNSDIIRLNVLGSNIIILNSAEAITDLLEKRSQNYSDRNEMVMLNELCGMGWGTAFLRYNNFWKDQRRAFQQDFHPEGVKRFRPIEEEETYLFLEKLLKRPEDFMDHLRHMAGAAILKIAYGIEIQPENDPFLYTAERATEAISATTNAGSYLVDVLPFLKYVPAWFPGAGFQREARVWKRYAMKMLHEPFEMVKHQVEIGVAPDCVAGSLLETMVKGAKDTGYMESVARGALASMYVAGADTTVSALGSFILAMVLYPEVQQKAQAEIDQCCSGRLPTFADYNSLTYCHAILREALRWNPVVPLAVPHRCSTDDFYKGCYIPKDSLLVGNTWAMLHDEAAYPDPLIFNPDRFIKDGRLNPEVRDPTVSAFGYGRRICAGRHMAYESMWFNIASILAVFNLAKAKDEHGVEITPSEEYIMGFLCYPQPFKCDIRPRSSELQALLEATRDNISSQT
ncbi:cytochrome P450 [Irpex rosettiformis]|uniref:Cytochrome P450 n=1 Tax=Irpex rosettiformis TaxID=378272 RepID=A0ACB8UMF2_9APHY|nr:cytochrome P450 [Irpex rosettiformis]